MFGLPQQGGNFKLIFDRRVLKGAAPQDKNSGGAAYTSNQSSIHRLEGFADFEVRVGATYNVGILGGVEFEHRCSLLKLERREVDVVDSGVGDDVKVVAEITGIGE